MKHRLLFIVILFFISNLANAGTVMVRNQTDLSASVTLTVNNWISHLNLPAHQKTQLITPAQSSKVRYIVQFNTPKKMIITNCEQWIDYNNSPKIPVLNISSSLRKDGFLLIRCEIT